MLLDFKVFDFVTFFEYVIEIAGNIQQVTANGDIINCFLSDYKMLSFSCTVCHLTR